MSVIYNPDIWHKLTIQILTPNQRSCLLLEVQDEIVPFTEKPSDKHTLRTGEWDVLKTSRRRNPFELFSLFTADIIKKKVVYTKVGPILKIQGR